MIPVIAYLETGLIPGHLVAGPLTPAAARAGWTHLVRDDHTGEIYLAMYWQVEERRADAPATRGGRSLRPEPAAREEGVMPACELHGCEPPAPAVVRARWSWTSADARFGGTSERDLCGRCAREKRQEMRELPTGCYQVIREY